jgi:hypothetical protein
MAGAQAQRHEGERAHSAQEAALRLLLEEARLLALNAAIESAAAREADLAGDDAAAQAQDIAAAAERLLQQIQSAASLDRPL